MTSIGKERSRHVVHLLCSTAFAGVERYVSQLAPVQSAHGWHVTVIGGAPEPMTAALRETDVRYYPAASIRDGRVALRSASHADVVNTHMSNADLAGIMALIPRGPRLVSTRHFASPRGRSRFVRTAFGLARGRFDAQIAISRFVADAIGEPSTVVHTGVTDAAAGASDRRIVLMAQRLEAEKSGDVAIRAWAASRAPRQGWELHLAGDGACRTQLEVLSHELGVADSVRFLGHRSDVRDLMSTASLLLAPTAREGLGISVLEAMACALPIVASASGGHTETIGSVEGALLFTPGDDADAARILNAAIGDVSALRRYGLRAQRRQREQFTLPAQAAATLSVYEGCLR